MFYTKVKWESQYSCELWDFASYRLWLASNNFAVGTLSLMASLNSITIKPPIAPYVSCALRVGRPRNTLSVVKLEIYNVAVAASEWQPTTRRFWDSANNLCVVIIIIISSSSSIDPEWATVHNHRRRSFVRCILFRRLGSSGTFALDTALLKWVSEHVARAYTTPDSAVSYLNHA